MKHLIFIPIVVVMFNILFMMIAVDNKNFNSQSIVCYSVSGKEIFKYNDIKNVEVTPDIIYFKVDGNNMKTNAKCILTDK